MVRSTFGDSLGSFDLMDSTLCCVSCLRAKQPHLRRIVGPLDDNPMTAPHDAAKCLGLHHFLVTEAATASRVDTLTAGPRRLHRIVSDGNMTDS
jgi:hypothetical protein